MTSFPTKIDPRKKKLKLRKQDLDWLENCLPENLTYDDAYAIRHLLRDQRDLKTLEQLNSIVKPKGGMNYSPEALVRRATRRMNKAFQVSKKIGQGDQINILEIGCARGESLLGIQDAAIKYTGLDIDGKFFDEVRKRSKNQVECIEASADEIPLESETFDLIVSFNVFEHLMNLEGTISEIYRVLRPGGVFFTEFGPPWNSANGPHLTRYVGIPHVHHLFDATVVAEFVGRQDPYFTVNKQPIESYRNLFWYFPEFSCKYYWENLSYSHAWVWPYFNMKCSHIPFSERACTRIDAALVKLQ